MTKLEELIEKLCPNGVEYKILGDISCKISDGMHNLPKNIKSSGEYPILSAQNITNGNINIDTSKWVNHEIFERENKRNNVEKGDVLLTIVGAIGRTAVVKDNLKALFQRSVCVIKPNVKLLNSKFLYYVLNSTVVQSYIQNNAKGAAQKGLYLKQVAKIKLPVPPLEVQREIVRILDNFTFLTAELAAELAARQKQYEYYRDKLLTPKAEIKTVELGEVCTFVRGPFGGALKKEIFKPHGYAVYEQQHAIYRTLDFRYFIDKKKFDELKRFSIKPGDMIVSCSGTIGKTFIIPEDAPEGVINQALLKLTPHDELNVFYLQYFFENTISKELNGVARGGAIKNVPSVSELKAIKIPVPSLDVQERLVQVLDNFDAICSDLNIGLPAEIEARQKQYEYYRDKLLTFKELKKEA